MRRHIALSFLQKHVQLLVSVGSVMVLSRLISPEEAGIFSIGVAIAALTHAVRDFGVGNFLVKELEITPAKVQTAYTVSMIIALGLSLVLALVAVPVAAFYRQPEIATIIWVTTVGLLVSPFSTVNMALLLRNHRFLDIMKVSMTGAVASAAVSILLAWMGLGAKALALGQLASAVTLVLVSNLLWREGNMYRFSLQHWRDISNFGLHMTVSGVTEQLGARAGDLIVGKLVGFSAVGLLSRSGTLITMVQDSVQNSVMPVVLTNMAGDLRKSGNVVPLVLKSLQYFTVVLWPVFAVLAMAAHDAVLVLFGPKWVDAAPLTSILCWAAAIAAVSSLTATVCNVANRADLLSRYSTLSQAIRIVLILIGTLTGGLHTIVLMLVLAEAIQCTLAFAVMRRAIGITVRQVAAVCWQSLGVAVIVTVLIWLLTTWMVAPALVRLVVTGVSATFAWLFAVFIMRHPAVGELRMLTASIVAKVRPR